MSKVEKIEKIKKFLEGRDEQKYITGIEGNYTSNEVTLMIDHPDKGKYLEKQTFIPFLFVKDFKKLGKTLYNNKTDLEKAMKNHGITIKKLKTNDHPRLEHGYKFKVTTTKNVGSLIQFFSKAGYNIFNDPHNLFLTNTGLEQFFITTGKRLFKGYNSYNEVHKFYFDIETTSLKPEGGRIFLIGMKDNRGFAKVLELDPNNPDESEKQMIIDFFNNMIELKPSIVAGYNSEAFDFHYILGRARILGIDLGSRDEDGNLSYDCRTSLDKEYPLKRQRSTIKFGGETENYEKTVMWGINVIDIAHAVRATKAINSDIKGWGLKYICQYKGFAKPNRMYVKGDMIYSIWNENKNYYINSSNNSYKDIPEEYQNKPQEYLQKIKKIINKVNDAPDKNELLPKLVSISEFFGDDVNNVNIISGKEIIGQYLLDDLYETEMVDNDFCQANFMMGGIMPTTYVRSCTMGNASKWKMLMSTYSYENDVAIPVVDRKRDIVGGLSRLFKSGYKRNVLKMDFKSLYPSIQLTHDVFPSLDITNVLEDMLTYFRDGRIEYQELSAKHQKMYEETGDIKDKELASLYNTKQLPIKILANSQFGALSSPTIFNWGDNIIGEEITCTGRQYLRSMIAHFMKYGFTPIVIDTDGANLTIPDDVDNIKYINKEGVELIGYSAVLCEYNEKYMTGVMKLEEDGIFASTINIKRKNYATLSPKGKIKITGNSLKSSTLQAYVETTFKKAIALLLDGNGKDFIELYYSQLEKIYNKEIPLIQIANKAKVNQKVKDYQQDLLTKKNKNGRGISRSAHMELLIAANLDPDLGQNIYYVNNGTAKSHADLGHSYLVDEMDFITNPDKTGNYNVPRYIDAFNKRMGIFLVCFGKEVRETLIVTNPEKRSYYTDKEMELVSGMPLNTDNESEEDGVYSSDYDPLLHINVPLFEMEEREVVFWNLKGKDPRAVFNDFTLDLTDVKLLTPQENTIKKEQEELIIQWFSDNNIEVKSELDYILSGDLVIKYTNKYVKVDEVTLEETVTVLDEMSWVLSKYEFGSWSDLEVLDKEIYDHTVIV
jgi:DNA polymerase elongation subunit (family B)